MEEKTKHENKMKTKNLKERKEHKVFSLTDFFCRSVEDNRKGSSDESSY